MLIANGNENESVCLVANTLLHCASIGIVVVIL